VTQPIQPNALGSVVPVFGGGGGGGGILAGDVTGPIAANTVVAIQGVPVNAAAPNNGDVLEFDGAEWVPTPGGGGGTLQDAYDAGSTIAVVAADGPVALSNAADTTDVLTIDRTFAGSGDGIDINMGAGTTGRGLRVVVGGTGTAILVTDGIANQVGITPGLIFQSSGNNLDITVLPGGSPPGNLGLQAGGATAGNVNGGDVTLNAGAGSGTGTDGVINIGVTTASQVNLTANVLVTSAGLVQLAADGTLATPAIALGGETNTGFYQPSAARMVAVVAGVEHVVWRGGQNRGPIGSAAAPTWSFDADPNTGMYRGAGDICSFAAGGVVVFSLRQIPDGSTTSFNVVTEINQTAAHVTGFDVLRLAPSIISDAGTGTKNFIRCVRTGTDYFTVGWTGEGRFASDLEIDGALNHDGSTVGFYGTAPTAQSAAYAPTNVTPDRSYDADSTTLDEIADVLGTLIDDLQLTGLIG
jgi:hypothetical protein